MRHLVQGNVSWKNKANGFYANHSSGGNTWYNNTSFNNGTQYNMLASPPGEPNTTITLTGALAHIMRNNIGFPNRNSNMTGVDTMFNSWDLAITPANSDFLSVSDPSVSGTGMSIESSGALGPRAPDGSLPKIDFLKLAAASRMIDKGTNVGLPFVGTAPDLGAYEYGAVTTTGTGGAGGGGSGGTGGSVGSTAGMGGGAAGRGGTGGSAGSAGAGGRGGTTGGAGGATGSGGRGGTVGAAGAGGSSAGTGGSGVGTGGSAVTGTGGAGTGGSTATGTGGTGVATGTGGTGVATGTGGPRGDRHRRDRRRDRPANRRSTDRDRRHDRNRRDRRRRGRSWNGRLCVRHRRRAGACLPALPAHPARDGVAGAPPTSPASWHPAVTVGVPGDGLGQLQRISSWP